MDNQDKLILLFVLEQINFPVSQNTLLEICSVQNDWIDYFLCKSALDELAASALLRHVNPEPNFGQNTSGKNHTVYNAEDCGKGQTENQKLFVISNDGRQCLGHFFNRILKSTRDKIKLYITSNREDFKRSQAYTADYTKNNYGTYTVTLKINDDITTILSIMVQTDSAATAKNLCQNWQQKATNVYSNILDY